MKHLLAVSVLLACLPGPSVAAPDVEVERQVEKIERFAKEPFEQREREAAIRALGRIGGSQAAAALVPLFDDPFVHLRDHAVSAWIAMVEGERAGETLAWFSKKAAKHRSPRVRAGVATALGFAKGAPAGALLRARLLKERDEDVLVALLGAVERAGLPTGSDWKPAALLQRRGGNVALATADALVRWDACRTIPPDVRAACLESRDPLVRAAGVLVAGGSGDALPTAVARLLDPGCPVEPAIALAETLRRPSPSFPESERRSLLRALLAADAWRVRAAAIDTAVALWRADVVPLLIQRLGVEQGRLRLDLADALAELTGKDLGPDPELWASWWKASGEGLDLGPRPQGGRPRTEPPSSGQTRTAAFFRLPVYGRRVAFLLDCSGSMRDPVDERLPGGPSKFEQAREELARTLEGLDTSVSFDVFLYRYPSEYPPRPELTRALGGLKPRTRARARKALAWMGRQAAKGWGAFSDALALLLEEEVDTIFFLSDGRPSRGRFDRGFRLIAELERANRFRQVVVHTVLTGHARADRAFLEDLARSTGGRFSDGAATSRR